MDMHLNMPTETRKGFCRCGCGQQTTLIRFSNKSTGRVKGEPYLYRNGHASRSPLKYVIDPVTGCWVWVSTKQPNGYGVLFINQKRHMAHRAIYEQLRGRVPRELDLDHICRNRACVNPDHLRQATRAQNTRAGLVPRLKEAQIPLIRQLHSAGTPIKRIAEQFSVSCGAIYAVIDGRTWRDVA